MPDFSLLEPSGFREELEKHFHPLSVIHDLNAVVAYDKFNRATLGNADSGQIWNVLIENSLQLDEANRSMRVTTSGDDALMVVAGSTGDVALQTVVASYSGSAARWFGVAFRVIDANNYLAAQCNGGGTAIRLIKVEAGVLTTLDETSAARELTRGVVWANAAGADATYGYGALRRDYNLSTDAGDFTSRTISDYGLAFTNSSSGNRLTNFAAREALV